MNSLSDTAGADDMMGESKLYRIPPAELPGLLQRLDDGQTTDLALIGPTAHWASAAPDEWPEGLHGRVVYQLTEESARLPRELLQLDQLQVLTLRHLSLRTEAVAAIAENLGQLTSLDLSTNQVNDDGARIIAEKLRQLTSLNLCSNQVGEDGVQAIAENLNQLTSLELWNNQVGNDGARAIAEKLRRLTLLNLGCNHVSEDGAQVIAEHLSQLTSLSLGLNRTGAGGARAIAEKLGQLTSLSLWGNQIGSAGVRVIAEKLGQLTSLTLSNNRMGDDDTRAIAENLGQLTSLFLAYNDVGDEGVLAIGQHLPSLVTLDLQSNERITTVGPLAHRPLSNLNITKTGVTDLSPLKSKVLDGLPVKWSDRQRRGPGIFVKDCPLTHPSPEVASQGPEAVLNYFREIEAQGVEQLFEAKLLILGEGGAGKTSLVRRMFLPGTELPTEDETTRGIDIHRHTFPISDGRTFRLNTWDFGGQQIYHATHQFFLTKRSLYVLVDDTRKDHRSIHDDGFKFWLEAIETLSESCPLLIFQNEKGGRSKTIDEADIKGRFPNVRGTYRGNLEQAAAADGVRRAVEHFVQELPHIGEGVPAKWVAIRQDLEDLAQSKPYISFDEYVAVYSRHLRFDPDKALHLSQYLHDLGVFLHFQQAPELRRTVFLQNQWVTDAVFRIVDDEGVKSELGRFNLADCDRLWSDGGYAKKDVELRALMVRFELCYRLPDTDVETWLVPQHLSPSKPPELGDWAKTGDLVLTYSYGFLPKGLVSRLIVRKHRFVRQPDLCWSRGALFAHAETQVLVETTARGNEIALRSRGPEKQGLLGVIASDLDALNDSFQGLKTKSASGSPASVPRVSACKSRQCSNRRNCSTASIEASRLSSAPTHPTTTTSACCSCSTA